MHYYQFNIKDYSFATIRMTLMEDLAFRRMLDVYYETEKPLPCELKRVAKLIGMIDYQEEVRSILNDFWTETESGWVNSRAQEEITTYQSKVDTARVNGRKGGRPKNPEITQSVSVANPEITGSKANHKPLTINQELSKLIKDGFTHWWNLYPSSRRVNKTGCLTKFKAKCKGLDEDGIIGLINLISNDITKRVEVAEHEQFIPTTEPYLNKERWNDGQ